MPAVVITSSDLKLSMPVAWEMLRETRTLRRIAEGFASYRGEMPSHWRLGDSMDIRPKFTKAPWSWLPEGSHVVNVIKIDPLYYQIETQEHGGVVKSWHHEMRITSLPGEANRCTYTDTVTIDAGLTTTIVVRLAKQLYEHRHRGWQQIANSHQ